MRLVACDQGAARAREHGVKRLTVVISVALAAAIALVAGSGARAGTDLTPSAMPDASPAMLDDAPTADRIVIVDATDRSADTPALARLGRVRIASGIATIGDSTVLVVLRYDAGDPSLRDWIDVTELTLSDVSEPSDADLPADQDARLAYLLSAREIDVDRAESRDDGTLPIRVRAASASLGVTTGDVRVFALTPARDGAEPPTLSGLIEDAIPTMGALRIATKGEDHLVVEFGAPAPADGNVVSGDTSPIGGDVDHVRLVSEPDPSTTGTSPPLRTLTCMLAPRPPAACSYTDADGATGPATEPAPEATPTHPQDEAQSPTSSNDTDPADEAPSAAPAMTPTPDTNPPDDPDEAPKGGPMTIPTVKAGAFHLRWHGHDAESGVGRYFVHVRAFDGFDNVSSSLVYTFDAAVTEWVTGLEAGRRYCFALKVRDNAGNESAWTPWRCVNAA